MRTIAPKKKRAEITRRCAEMTSRPTTFDHAEVGISSIVLQLILFEVVGDYYYCRNSFFVFVSDRSRSGLAENLGQIRFS
jgi:hypothetical protein